MATDCVDICDIVISIMCRNCPNYKGCQNVEDEANHHQMEVCMVYNGALKAGDYPVDFEPLETEEEAI